MAILCAFGYDPPDPPIPEEGVEVNVGDSDYGLGEEVEPASQSGTYAPPSARNDVATQQSEPAPSVQASSNPGTITNPHSPQENQVQNKEPEINANALFRGNRNRSEGGSQGNTAGTGNQGKENGTTTSNMVGDGGTGSTFNLKDRQAARLPMPEYKSNEQGQVVVKIWVDRQGKVTRVEAPAQGSTISGGRLVNQAKQAALKARFNASQDAPEEQVGTITYKFEI